MGIERLDDRLKVVIRCVVEKRRHGGHRQKVYVDIHWIVFVSAKKINMK